MKVFAVKIFFSFHRRRRRKTPSPWRWHRRKLITRNHGSLASNTVARKQIFPWELLISAWLAIYIVIQSVRANKEWCSTNCMTSTHLVSRHEITLYIYKIHWQNIRSGLTRDWAMGTRHYSREESVQARSRSICYPGTASEANNSKTGCKNGRKIQAGCFEVSERRLRRCRRHEGGFEVATSIPNSDCWCFGKSCRECLIATILGLHDFQKLGLFLQYLLSISDLSSRHRTQIGRGRSHSSSPKMICWKILDVLTIYGFIEYMKWDPVN